MPQISNKDTRQPPGTQPGSTSPRGRLPKAPQPAPHQDRAGTSFAARFGRVILAHGIAALPSALYHFQGKLKLSAQQVWFVSYILSHKWDEDLPYPSLKKMEKSTGISERHLRRMKSGLCQKGLLEVYARFGERERRDTDAYDFSGLFGRLEKLLAAEPPPPNAIRVEGPALDATELGQVDSSFVARYGRVIARHGVTAVPRAIFTHQSALGLTPQQVWFVTYIFSFQWDMSLPYPSIRRMGIVTGYSSVQLHNIKAELVRAGYLSLVHRRDDQGGQDTNAYDFSGLLDSIRTLLQREESGNLVENASPIIEPEEEEPLRRGRKPRQRIENGSSAARPNGAFEHRGDSYLPTPEDLQLTGVGDRELSGGTDLQFIGAGDRQLRGGGDSELSGAGKHTSAGRVTRALPGGRTRGLHEIESKQIERIQKGDSNQRSKKGVSGTKESSGTKTGIVGIPGYSPYIASVAADFSRELGDLVHEASNMKQALNLWGDSGLSEQEFVDLMQEARKLTRRYQSRPTWDAMSNKMSYYFTVVRDLVQRRERD